MIASRNHNIDSKNYSLYRLRTGLDLRCQRGTAIFAQKRALFEKNAKRAFLIENTEGRFALDMFEHKETGRAPQGNCQ
jgi:hypothetical protein